MKGKQAVIEALRREGVRYVFGNPGTSEMPILAALSAAPDLRYVLATQEGVAVGMADGYARSSGQPAFVLLHRDTGLANGISLLINSCHGGTPVVLSAVNTDQRKLLEGRVDLTRMVGQFTKWSLEVTRPELVSAAFRRAFEEALRPPAGPVFISLAFDVLDAEFEPSATPGGRTWAAMRPDEDAIEAAANLLVSSSKTLLLLGDRVTEEGAFEEALRLAELLACDVHSAHPSEVNFPTGHPLFRGSMPALLPEERGALADGTTVVAVGTSVFGGFFYLPGALSPGARLIHLDSSLPEIGKCEPTEIGIPGNLRAGLAALRSALETFLRQRGVRPPGPWPRRPPVAARPVPSGESEDGKTPMSADTLMRELARVLPRHAIVVEDAGTAAGALHRALEFNAPGSLHGVRGGAIGWGMGAALGVRLARPDRPVVCLLGDGTAMMTIQALWTAARENLRVVYVICNNASYRVLRLNAAVYRRTVPGTRFDPAENAVTELSPPIDFARTAVGLGVRGQRIEAHREVGPAIEQALAYDGPSLLDVIIDGVRP